MTAVMPMDKKLEEDLKEVRRKLLDSDKRRALFVSTAANLSNPAVVISPLRESALTCGGSVIFRDTASVAEVIDLFRGVVTTIFLDTEVKNEARELEDTVRTAAGGIEIVPYKPNDLTVAACELFFSARLPDLRDAKAVVIGAGNIGTKVAMLLAEMSCSVTLIGRNEEKVFEICRGLNNFQRGRHPVGAGTDSAACLPAATVIVGATPGVPAIDRAAARLISPHAIVLDIGNGLLTADAAAFFSERSQAVYCLSFELALRGYLHAWELSKDTLPKLGRLRTGPATVLITPGILGAHGDILVDDTLRPQKIYGVCNGRGGVLSRSEAEPFLNRMTEDDRKS